ncbi:MAG: hypothetical protein ACM3XM_05195 [Mycobacterium leprae]
MSSIADLQKLVVDFSTSRGWNVYNTPKSLSMSIAIEAAEIMEHYQWVQNDEKLDPARVEEVALECVDVLWYMLRLAEAEGIDLEAAFKKKAAINEGRFPPQIGRPGRR